MSAGNFLKSKNWTFWVMSPSKVQFLSSDKGGGLSEKKIRADKPKNWTFKKRSTHKTVKIETCIWDFGRKKLDRP